MLARRLTHAPLDWIMDGNRKALVGFFVLYALIVSITAFSVCLNKTQSDLAHLLLPTVVLTLANALVISKRYLAPVFEVATAMCTFLMITASQHTITLLSDVLALRMRSQAIALVFWKLLLGMLGLPIIPTAVIMGVLIVMDVVGALLCQLRHGDPFPRWMAVVPALLALLSTGVASLRMESLRALYDAHQALSAEKALMEAIITMMCDSIIWLSEDGSTVVRVDGRFAVLVGRNAVGEQLAEVLAEEELGRVEDCLKRAETGPVLLPTTLTSDAGARIPVEMFVVGNRTVSASMGLQQQTPAFLIGIRMASSQGTEELGIVGMRQDHTTMLAQSQTDGGAGGPPEVELQSADIRSCSLPETSSTGRIFTRMDVERWLQSSPEDRAAELRSGLEMVDRLGQREHWLLSQQDLELSPNELLGAGAFGFVMGGWLHGLPVAVKAARRSNDASIEHLVAVASEIRVFRHLRHPNVALFFGACVEPLLGELLLVAERVKGPDLYSHVIEHNTDAEVYGRFQLLLDVTAALRYLHSQSPQIVHGDLKGSNVLVEAAVPRAKLVDFGLSRVLTRNAKPLGGSLPWMAPELILQPATRPRPSADVFSFGRLAYMILACRKPLEGMRSAAIKEMARLGLAHNLVWDEGRPLHRECAALCRHMLKPVPEERPDMREVHQQASAWELPELHERMPAMELVRAAQGAAAAPLAGGSVGPLAGAVQSLREALAAAPGHAPQLEQVAEEAGAPLTPQAAVEVGDSPLVLRTRPRTDTSAQTFLLVDVLRQWNYPFPPDACCKYHAAIAELRRVTQRLRTNSCDLEFAPYEAFQCRRCGMLDFETHSGCPICDRFADRTPSLADTREVVPEPVDLSPGAPPVCRL